MLTGLVIALAAVAAACVVGLLRRRTDGAVRAASASEVLTPAELGRDLGSRATFVQFSSAFCAPCRTTRVLLGQVAGELDGVAHVELDAADHLDLVRRFDITRTPTVLVLDGSGQVVKRATGAPRRQDVLAAVAQAADANLV